MLKMDDYSKRSLKRNSSWIKEYKQEEKNFLNKLAKIRDQVIDLRMDSRDIIGKTHYQLVSMESMENILNTHKPLGLFWAKDTKANLYIAVNNNIGKAYKKEFRSLEECINWLMKEEV